MSIVLKGFVVCNGWGPYYNHHDCGNRAEALFAQDKEVSDELPKGWYVDRRKDYPTHMCPKCSAELDEDMKRRYGHLIKD